MIQKPEVGEVYKGKILQVRDDGAIVEYLPGKRGWLHISEIAHEKIHNIHDYIRVGEEREMKLIHLDPLTGKVRLSIKALTPPPPPTYRPPQRRKPHRPTVRRRTFKPPRY